MKNRLSTYQYGIALSASFVFMSPVNAQTSLTVVSFGGVIKEAKAKAYYAPFTKQTGIKIISGDYDAGLAKIKAMVATKRVSWDVVATNNSDMVRGCEEGLLEKLDYSKIGKKSDFVSGAAQPCGIASYVWSSVLTYNANKLKTAPKGWQDFWDVKQFPGKRGLRKSPQIALEVALMADGVALADVYKTLRTPAGVNRAFKKLDQLKPYIQWWEVGAQPAQYLASGDVVMSSAYNGRIAVAQKEGKPLKIVWPGSIYQFDNWVIPKGTPQKAAAYQFIAFASKAENQQALSRTIAYGPVNKQAIAELDKPLLSNLPTAPQHIKAALKLDVEFWADNGEALEQRFNAWTAK